MEQEEPLVGVIMGSRSDWDTMKRWFGSSISEGIRQIPQLLNDFLAASKADIKQARRDHHTLYGRGFATW